MAATQGAGRQHARDRRRRRKLFHWADRDPRWQRSDGTGPSSAPIGFIWASWQVQADAQKQIADVEKQYRKGVITPGERYNKVVDIWTHCTDQIANVMLRTLDHNQGKAEYNPVSLMVDSGVSETRRSLA